MRTLCVEEYEHVCDETNSLVQENALEDEDAGFPDKHTALEVESKVKDFEQSKETTITPPKDLPKQDVS